MPKNIFLKEKEDSLTVERYLNLARNDVENILPFFIASFLWQEYTNLAVDWIQLVGAILGGLFCISRYGHTICYMCGFQPWRSVFYFLGVLVTLVLLIWNIVFISLIENIDSYPVHITVIVCWTFLSIKLYFLAFYTGYLRYKKSIPAVPEDIPYLPEMETVTEVRSGVERLLNCHHEELQILLQLTIPTTLIWTSNLEKIDFLVISACFFGITILRLLHTFFYILALKRHRKNCFRGVIFVGTYFLMLVLLYWLIVRQIMTSFGL